MAPEEGWTLLVLVNISAYQVGLTKIEQTTVGEGFGGGDSVSYLPTDAK